MTPPISVEVRLTPADRAEARRVLIRPGAQPAGRRGRLFRGILAWGLFIALAVFFYVFLQRRAPLAPQRSAAGFEERPPPATRYETFALYTFLVAALTFVAALLWAIRLGRRWQRATDEGLIAPVHVFTLGEDGLTDVTPGKRIHWYWRSFQTFAETDHLFVLRELPYEGKIIPKRLFAGDEEVGRVRELLARKLAEPVSQSVGGFEVSRPAGGT
jgi:hypothetical protein